jgi:hypothetical protein
VSEPLVRLVVVVAVLGLAAAVALLQRRGAGWRRVSRRFPDVGPGLVLFASATCASCDRAIEVLDGLERPPRVVRYEMEQEMFERLGIRRVPAVAWVGADGNGWISYGIPRLARIRGWLADP